MNFLWILIIHFIYVNGKLVVTKNILCDANALKDDPVVRKSLLESMSTWVIKYIGFPEPTNYLTDGTEIAYVDIFMSEDTLYSTVITVADELPNLWYRHYQFYIDDNDFIFEAKPVYKELTKMKEINEFVYDLDEFYESRMPGSLKFALVYHQNASFQIYQTCDQQHTWVQVLADTYYYARQEQTGYELLTDDINDALESLGIRDIREDVPNIDLFDRRYRSND